jgi:hypothetical protein
VLQLLLGVRDIADALRRVSSQHPTKQRNSHLLSQAAAAAAAAQHTGTLASQSIPALLSSAPLLLACDAASLDFWSASQASAEHAAAHPLPATTTLHVAALPSCSARSWLPQVQLSKAPELKPLSTGIQEVVELLQAEQQQQRDRLLAEADEEESDEEEEGGACGFCVVCASGCACGCWGMAVLISVGSMVAYGNWHQVQQLCVHNRWWYPQGETYCPSVTQPTFACVHLCVGKEELHP